MNYLIFTEFINNCSIVHFMLGFSLLGSIHSLHLEMTFIVTFHIVLFSSGLCKKIKSKWIRECGIYLLATLKWNRLCRPIISAIEVIFILHVEGLVKLVLITCSRCRLLLRICCCWVVQARRTPDCHTVSHTARSACDLALYCCRCRCGYCSWRSYSDQNLSQIIQRQLKSSGLLNSRPNVT